MRLVPNWRACWRWNCVHMTGLAGVLIASWNLLPDKMQDAIPRNVLLAMAYGLLALIVIGRLRDQNPPEKKPCISCTTPPSRPLPYSSAMP